MLGSTLSVGGKSHLAPVTLATIPQKQQKMEECFTLLKKQASMYEPAAVMLKSLALGFANEIRQLSSRIVAPAGGYISL